MFILLKKYKFLNLKVLIFLIFVPILIYLFFFNRNNNLHNNNISKIAPENLKSSKLLPIVAHAGGEYNGQIYTNSLEALNLNIDFYKYFELDFHLTGDKKLVCSHDYGEHLKTYDLFVNYQKISNRQFKECDYISLKKWLKNNKNKYIITDFKDDNIEGLRFISQNFENYKKIFIPQIYHPKEYLEVKRMGFEKIIWTLYRYGRSNNDILAFASNMNLYAITMPVSRIKTMLPYKLLKLNIYSYGHTINKFNDYDYLRKKYFLNQVYTDNLGTYFFKNSN